MERVDGGKRGHKSLDFQKDLGRELMHQCVTQKHLKIIYFQASNFIFTS